MNKKVLIITGIAVTIIAIIFGMLMIKIIMEHGKCIDDPFKYSAIKLKQSGGDYFCSCKSLNSELLDFNFNESGIQIMDSDITGLKLIK